MNRKRPFRHGCRQSELSHKGKRLDRLTRFQPHFGSPNCERIFIAQWIRAQERHGALNSGYGTLELLLAPKPPQATWQPWADRTVPSVSQRDADVAAAVIQWLGTGCGLCFLQECERKIEKARERCHRAYDEHWNKRQAASA